jgi:DNA repair protein RecO (recombination protein O)
MDWQDDGILLTTRPQGESSALVEVLTARHGRHLGVVRGGQSRRMAGVLIPGTQLALHWQARLADQLGTFKAEPMGSRAAVMADPGKLMAMNAAIALLHHALPERDPCPGLYAQSFALFETLAGAGDWLSAYVTWELALLAETGFGLDLTRCAVSGSTEDLAYVSPRTGRAVSRVAAGDWAPRLLPLPRMLRPGANGPTDPEAALALTAPFLERMLEGDLPASRSRFHTWLARHNSVAD